MSRCILTRSNKGTSPIFNCRIYSYLDSKIHRLNPVLYSGPESRGGNSFHPADLKQSSAITHYELPTTHITHRAPALSTNIQGPAPFDRPLSSRRRQGYVGQADLCPLSLIPIRWLPLRCRRVAPASLRVLSIRCKRRYDFNLPRIERFNDFCQAERPLCPLSTGRMHGTTLWMRWRYEL